MCSFTGFYLIQNWPGNRRVLVVNPLGPDKDTPELTATEFAFQAACPLKITENPPVNAAA